MSINIDNLKKLIESIRNINFFQRLFSWGKVRQQLIDGVSDIQKMESALEHLSKENENISSELHTITAKFEAAQEIVSRYDGEKEKLNYMIEEKGNKLTNAEKDLSTVQKENENLRENIQKSTNEYANLKQK